MVQLVACRSPKPQIKVQVLIPLLINEVYIYNKKEKNKKALTAIINWLQTDLHSVNIGSNPTKVPCNMGE